MAEKGREGSLREQDCPGCRFQVITKNSLPIGLKIEHSDGTTAPVIARATNYVLIHRNVTVCKKRRIFTVVRCDLEKIPG